MCAGDTCRYKLKMAGNPQMQKLIPLDFLKLQDVLQAAR